MRPIAAVQMLVFDVLEMTAFDPKQPVGKPQNSSLKGGHYQLKFTEN